MTARCPDCSAVMVARDRHLEHDETCPLGLALDAVVDEDRDWFAAHPFTTVRHRPLHAVERTEYCMFGYWETAHMTHVQVIQVKPGLRVRHPYGDGHRSYSDGQVEHVRAYFLTAQNSGGAT